MATAINMLPDQYRMAELLHQTTSAPQYTATQANAYLPPQTTSAPQYTATQANAYLPPRTTSAPRTLSHSNTRTYPTTGKSGTVGTTGTTAATAATVPPVAAPVQAAPAYIPPQVAQGGLTDVRRPTPCELGLGGCENPVNVASNVAAWQLNGDQPLSLHDQRYLQPLMQQAAQGEVAAAQAGAAALYDRSLANPAFQSTVRANMEQGGMPYNLAVANARSQWTPSTYAENLLGTPNIIRAADAAASQNQAAAAVANAPYTYGYENNAAGYVPSVQSFDPATGSYTVNNRQYVNTGLTGPSVPLAVGQSIAPGLQAGYIPTALSNIAAVGEVERASTKTNAQFEQALAMKDVENQALLQRQQIDIQGQKDIARLIAELKAAPPVDVAPKPVVK